MKSRFTLMPLSIAISAVLASAIAPQAMAADAPAGLAAINRATWGLPADLLDAKPEAALRMPAAAQVQIDAMRISREPMVRLAMEMDAQNRENNKIPDPAQREAAKKAWRQTMGDLGREAATRSLLRDLYSPDQMREQMTWFWFNQFNVHEQKRDIRVMVGDYEDTIRRHALGRFRDLLEATLRHPAMLRYLDNDQNALGHINENYAREIMELHTMGVGSGYSQKDVQELARILTGVGVSLKPEPPRLKPEWQDLYQRDGLFEFNPARHDFGTKQFMGHTIHGSGYHEVDQALDLIANNPATARRLSTRIATYFMGDAPPAAVVDRMVAAWRQSGGDIATVLRAMIASPAYAASLGHAFKDPVHYLVSSVRYTFGSGRDGKVVTNLDPMINWLNRMGEGLYERQTPDGYPLNAAAWTGPGQMEARFEIAKAIGNGASGLFRPRDAGPGNNTVPAPPSPAASTVQVSQMQPAPPPPAPKPPAPPPPHLQNALWLAGVDRLTSAQTRAVLDQAASPQEWNMLFLASPDFMRR